jgi:hypothetical protein
MTKIKANRGVLLLALGVLIGIGVSSAVHSLRSSATVLAQAPAPDLAAMQADIAHLKEVVPSQSHAMTDVGYQFANLWFAGKQKNWPLADFFLNESRQHITWTIRMRPVRKDTEGNPVDLKAIFDTISNGPLKALTQSIQDKNDAEFADSYKKDAGRMLWLPRRVREAVSAFDDSTGSAADHCQFRVRRRKIEVRIDCV